VLHSRGTAVDVAYFGLTALSALVIGCKRSPLQSVELTAPLTKRQVLFAPVAASCTLFGAYLVLRFTPLDIGLVFNALTTVLGGVCLKEALDPIVVSTFNLLRAENRAVADIEKPEYPGEPVPQVLASDAVAAAVSAAVVAAYALPPSVLPALAPVHFVFSNAIAVGIAARVLALIRPDSFVAAAGLLAGLCLYDIWWVFGTDVMVTVALKIDSPGKLLFPRDPATLKSAASYAYAVLGLGDLVVPGVFATLALALDAFIVQKRDPAAPPSVVPAGPYFRAAVAAYVLGLGTCFGVNYVTGAAQPALLYLVPALISSALLTAGARGELADVVQFRTPSKGSVFGGSDEDRPASAEDGQ
jgi:minor histocompatibility antigen H13